MRQPSRLLLVLHGHIPDVMGHGTWPHGANWIYEAAAETYLPFLRMAGRLVAEGVPIKATLGMTPVLSEQLEDRRFITGFDEYLTQRAKAAGEDREEFSRLGDGATATLAEWWRGFYEDLRTDFEALPGQDILTALRGLVDLGVLEPIASAATHGFLPLLPTDRAIERQLDVGLAAHERHFGRPAKGIWLPECAYRPAGPWISPADGHPEIRCGLEEFLAERGVEFFFVETHLVRGGVTHPAYGGEVVREDQGHSPYRIHSMPTQSGAQVSVLARDPLSSQQVWSGKVGYPGDGRYLEFHKKRAPSGHRYWRVTDPRVELGDKLPYGPSAIAEALEVHAAHFVSLLEEVPDLPDGSAPVIVAMFDFELFGHWWFEGVEFIAQVFRGLAGNARVVPSTTSEALAANPPLDAISMPAGTWGRDGDFQVWWNSQTVPYWKLVDAMERRLEELEERAGRGEIPAGLYAALVRQSLLLQSSDWPFLIDNEVSRDYAEARIKVHAANFESLVRLAETGEDASGTLIQELDDRDRLFGPELGAMAAALSPARA
jgi:1,4-alpha-glucan branching enzyme